MKHLFICILFILFYGCTKNTTVVNNSSKPSMLIFHIEIDTPGATFNAYARNETKSYVLFSYVNYSYLIRYPGISDTILLQGEYQHISGDTVSYFAYSYLTDKFKVSVSQDGKILGEKFPTWNRISQIYSSNLKVAVK